jgi:hypothetical protein
VAACVVVDAARTDFDGMARCRVLEGGSEPQRLAVEFGVADGM